MSDTPLVDALDNEFAAQGADNGPECYAQMRKLARTLERALGNAAAELRAVCFQMNALEDDKTIEPKLFARNVREGMEIEVASIEAALARKEAK